MAFTTQPDFVGFAFLDVMRRFSAGDLRPPRNAADRHNAVMIEAWRARQSFAPPRRRTAGSRPPARASIARKPRGKRGMEIAAAPGPPDA